MTTLQLGDSGAEISELQERLYQLGYEFYGGGEFDAHTQEAVRRFQTDCGLEPTGIADDNTMDHLGRYGPATTEQSTAASEPQAAVGNATDQVVDQNGNVLVRGTAQMVNREGALGALSGPAREALEVALKTNLWTAPMVYALDLANALGWTVAVGVDGDAATDPAIGLTAGAGLYFAPGNDWGLYGTIGADVGAIWGVSANACIIVLNGGPDKLAGPVWAIEGSGGDAFGAGVAVLFNTNGEFIGISGEVGGCAGIPASAYASFTNTWLVRL